MSSNNNEITIGHGNTVLGSSTSSTSSGTTLLWKVLQFCNTIVVCGLVGVVIFLFLQVQYITFKLNSQQDDIDSLRIQVQEKQEIQIQELNEAVQQEHDLTLQTLAGTFTLLTCLISMFHMSSHVRNYYQPNIQRKIVTILWMSPIYSCTSFLSLLFPSAQEYLSIIKDFYESYCIYTFLSFLIAVLGKDGCSGNTDGNDGESSFRDAVVDVLSKHTSHLDKPTRCLRSLYHPPPETSDRAYANAVLTECQILCLQFVFIRPITSVLNFAFTFGQEELQSYETTHHGLGNNGTNRFLLMNGGGSGGGHNADSFVNYTTSTSTSTVFDQDGGLGGGAVPTPAVYPTAAPVAVFQNTTGMMGENDEFSQAAISYFTSPGFYFAMITNVSVFLAFTGLLKFYHAVRDDLVWCQPFPKFLTIKGVVFVTFWQGLVISIVVNLKQRNGTTSHWAQNELDDDPRERAEQLQNVLICLEMLFFSITHWCVFPAEEWEPNYQPRKVGNPGIGFKDFVSDVSEIYNQAGNNRRSAARRRRNKKLQLQQLQQRHRGGRDGYGSYQVADANIGLAPTAGLEDDEDDTDHSNDLGLMVDGNSAHADVSSSGHDDVSTSDHDEDASNNSEDEEFDNQFL